jgi:hypothetical protein
MVFDLSNPRLNRARATRHEFDVADLYRRVATMVDIPLGSHISYFHDRARIFFPDGQVRDFPGGQAMLPFAPTISRL